MKKNPFVIGGYVSPEYFCDRDIEKEKLKSAIFNQRHLTLFSLRRMGKTGLINHFFFDLSGSNNYITIYVDIMHTLNFSEFIAVLARSIFSNYAKNQNVLKKLLSGISSLRPTIMYDSITGNPEITIKLSNEQDQDFSLDAIFNFISQQKQHYIIAIDEFQQVAKYPEQTTEAKLRSYIQKTKNAVFIFCGSQRHLITEIFSNPNRPFYNSTEIMEIGSINSEVYKSFIKSKFESNGIEITENALTMIEQLTAMHTFYVQFLCNRLFSNRLKRITEFDVEAMYRTIIQENESIYANYINLLTHLQYKLLRAIAQENGAEALTSNDFLSKYELGAASSVTTAAKSLIEKDFLFVNNNKFFLVDKYFEGWLVSKYI
jgi:AAA+ ATPase superfamily predicted ATPase